MSGTKRISALTELASGSVDEDDILAIVDMSQASVTDKTKHVKVKNLIAVGGRLEIDSFAELATKFVGSSPSSTQQIAATGDIVVWREKGFRYQCVTSGEHFDYTGSGGLKWKVLPNLDGYHVNAFGSGFAAAEAAFSVANALVKTGLGSSILHPGATVVMDAGDHDWADIDAPIQVLCNVVDLGANISIPAAYSGEVWRIGSFTSGELLSAPVTIQIPNTNKPNNSALSGTAVRVGNINAGKIYFGRMDWFDKTYHFGGIGQGTVYCDIFLGQTSYANIIEYIVPGSAGWCNANNFFGGNFRLGGRRESGKRFVKMDGSSPATAIVGNVHIGTSYEALGAEYNFELKNAYGNTWVSPYIEYGTEESLSVTVSGDTITSVGHEFSVDDPVLFAASSLPTGMLDVTPYWVVTVPDADTFKVARSKSGSAITFSSAGTSVVAYPQARNLFDGTSGLCYNNRILNKFSPPSALMLDAIESGQAYGNGESGPNKSIFETNELNDAPIVAARNKSSSASSRPAFAAYATGTDPKTNPLGWSTAIGDRGLLYAASGAEAGRLWQSAGTLQWQPAGQATAQVPNGFRSSSLTTLGTTNVVAGSRALVTITVTGAAVGDYVIPYTQSALTDGILIAFARVSAANTVQICFYNWTAGDIDIAGTQLKAMVLRNFY